MRSGEIDNFSPSTIYIGGGTPSILTPNSITSLCSRLSEYIDLSAVEEFTMEMNPDDVTPQYLDAISHLPINRISMGLQSFNDDELKFLRRRHSASEAERSFNLLREYGYNNISIDLIFALPNQTMDIWSSSVQRAVALNPEHISSYNLTYEGNSALKRMLDRGDIDECDDDLSFNMYSYLINTLSEHGYNQYEISNFAKQGYNSKHNSGYWSATPYLGLGASAHSYDGRVRRANISNIHKYISGIDSGSSVFEEEYLTTTDIFNEYIYTGIRRIKEGISLTYIYNTFGEKYYKHLKAEMLTYIKGGYLLEIDDSILLTESGIFISDTICCSLFYTL